MHFEYFIYPLMKWWERSKLRNWALENPQKVFRLAGISALLLIIAIIYVLIPTKQPQFVEPELGWYYDLNTNKIFKADATLVPPIDAPSGPDANGLPAGVKAFVYYYPDDPNDARPFLAFIQTTAPGSKEKFKQLMAQPNPSMQTVAALNRIMLIKRVRDFAWFTADSEPGRWIMTNTVAPRLGYKAVYYPPKNDKNTFEVND